MTVRTSGAGVSIRCISVARQFKGRLELHESGTFVRFTAAGAALLS
jgi:hypothetical protein